MSDMFTRKGNYKKWNGVGAFSNEINNTNKLINESASLEDKINYKNSFSNSTSERIINKNTKMKLMEEVRVRGTERAFAFTLTEAYFDSLVLDDDFKRLKENEIKSFFISKLKEEADGDIYAYMESCKGKSKTVDKLVDNCKKKGKKLEDKSKSKIDEDIKEFDINEYLNKEEENDIDYEKADVNEISNIVKEKVVQVIKDEEEKNKQTEEFIEDLKTAKSVDESASLFLKGNEEFTLFKSIMVKNYKNTLNEIKENNISESAYGGINEDNEIHVDMDYIMCDSILEYTNLELYHTLKLKTFSGNDVRKLAESFTYIK